MEAIGRSAKLPPEARRHSAALSTAVPKKQARTAELRIVASKRESFDASQRAAAGPLNPMSGKNEGTHGPGGAERKTPVIRFFHKAGKQKYR